MNILAVDTTGTNLSLALQAGARTLTLDRKFKSPHDETLVPQVEKLLARAGIDIKDLDAIAAAVGPGRFTGIRVGMGYAAVAAAELKVPALAVSHFEAIAFGARSRRLAAVVEGVRGEKFYQLFKRAGTVPKAEGPPAWVPAEDWSRLAGALSSSGRALEERLVTAADLLGPARHALGRKKRPRFEPLYIKLANFEKGKNTPRLAR